MRCGRQKHILVSIVKLMCICVISLHKPSFRTRRGHCQCIVCIAYRTNVWSRFVTVYGCCVSWLSSAHHLLVTEWRSFIYLFVCQILATLLLFLLLLREVIVSCEAWWVEPRTEVWLMVWLATSYCWDGQDWCHRVLWCPVDQLTLQTASFSGVTVCFNESCCEDCKTTFCALLYIAVGVHQLYIQLPNDVVFVQCSADK